MTKTKWTKKKILHGEWRLACSVQTVAELTIRQASDVLLCMYLDKPGNDGWGGETIYNDDGSISAGDDINPFNNRLKITLDYPMKKPVRFTIKPYRPVTWDIWTPGYVMWMASRKYAEVVYKDEASMAKYDVLHLMGDLYFESMAIDVVGRCTFGIGS